MNYKRRNRYFLRNLKSGPGVLVLCVALASGAIPVRGTYPFLSDVLSLQFAWAPTAEWLPFGCGCWAQLGSAACAHKACLLQSRALPVFRAGVASASGISRSWRPLRLFPWASSQSFACAHLISQGWTRGWKFAWGPLLHRSPRSERLKSGAIDGHPCNRRNQTSCSQCSSKIFSSSDLGRGSNFHAKIFPTENLTLQIPQKRAATLDCWVNAGPAIDRAQVWLSRAGYSTGSLTPLLPVTNHLAGRSLILCFSDHFRAYRHSYLLARILVQQTLCSLRAPHSRMRAPDSRIITSGSLNNAHWVFSQITVRSAGNLIFPNWLFAQLAVFRVRAAGYMLWAPGSLEE